MKKSTKAGQQKSASNVLKFPGVENKRPESARRQFESKIEIDFDSIRFQGVPGSNMMIVNALSGLERFGIYPGDKVTIVRDDELKRGDLVVRHGTTRLCLDRFEGTHLRLIYLNGKKIRNPKKDKNIVGKVTHIIRAI